MIVKMKAIVLASGRLCAVLAIFAAVIFLARIMSAPSSAQSPSIPQGTESRNERVFENTIPKDVPIKIKIKQEKEVSFKDLQNEKWLNEFELELTNTGDKPIYFLYITMGTGVKISDSEIVFPLHYGRAGLGDIVTKAEPDDVPIKPGETYVLKMGEVTAWEKGVHEGRWPQATKFRAELQALSFGDGTGYFGNLPYPPGDRRQSTLKDTLPELGLKTLDLNYKQSRRTDQYGTFAIGRRSRMCMMRKSVAGPGMSFWWLARCDPSNRSHLDVR